MKEFPARLLAFFVLLGVILLHPGQVWPADPPALVTITPEENDEILANPGVGWETFHRTAEDDNNLPDWIPSTIHYARWGWGTLEPRKGKIDYDFLNGVLKETREAGQTLAFRAMCCSTYLRRPYHPEWLREISGAVVMTRYRLSNSNGDTTKIVGLETVDKWMPGEIELFNEEFFEQPAELPPGPINEVAETIPLPEDLPSGTFALSIAVVGETAKEPVVQLGIKGRDEDGWYPVSTIKIVR